MPYRGVDDERHVDGRRLAAGLREVGAQRERDVAVVAVARLEAVARELGHRLGSGMSTRSPLRAEGAALSEPQPAGRRLARQLVVAHAHVARVDVAEAADLEVEGEALGAGRVLVGRQRQRVAGDHRRGMRSV